MNIELNEMVALDFSDDVLELAASDAQAVRSHFVPAAPASLC